jgi:hypothetical protein
MSQFYPLGLQALLQAFFSSQAPVGVVSLYVAGLDAGYVFDPTHTTIADIADHAVAQAVEITNAGVSGGAVGGDNVTFGDLNPGDVIDQLVVFAGWADDDGNQYSQLFVLLDNASSSSLPLTAQGDAATITWNPAGIFKIG